MRLPKILELPEYRNLWLGQTISQLGDSVYFMVFLFLAEKISKSASVTGVVAALQAIPFVIFSPVAGVAADRFDRRKVMLFADIASAAVCLGIVLYTFLFPVPRIEVLGLAAFGLSTINVFFMPARSASIPKLVPPDRLVEANGFAMATQQATHLLGVGFSAGALGAVYALFPNYFFGAAMLVDGLTFLASAWFIRKLPGLAAESAAGATGLAWSDVRSSLRSLWADVKVGLRAVKGDPFVVVALPMNVLSSLAISGFFIVYVVVNDLWYGGEFWTLALIELSFALVSLVFSIRMSTRKITKPGYHFAIGIGSIGLCVAGMAFAKPYVPFLLLNAACGLAFPSIIVPINAYFQTAFPDGVRGRVNSAWSMVSTAAQPLGLLFVSILMAVTSLESAFLAMGVAMAASGFVGLLFKGVREAELPV